MKTNKLLIGIVVFTFASVPLLAQEKNIVLNGSFEDAPKNLSGPGTLASVKNISSSNNTTIDLYSKNACGKNYSVPENGMGNQQPKTGNNYAGFIAYYADEAYYVDVDLDNMQILKSKPAYQKYSEYIQLAFAEPLVAGKAYNITYNISLAEKSAYAVSGIGVYFSHEKMDVQNNAFLNVVPNMVNCDIATNTEWTTVSGVYIAQGGEQYLTLGCFNKYMLAEKMIAPNTNNSRKAYYFIDDVGLTPQPEVKKEIVQEPKVDVTQPKTNVEITDILLGSCYRLHSLNFETDKSVILTDSHAELEILSKFVKTYPYILVYIDGHADKTGSDEHNEKLAEARANSVKDYLIKDGVDASQLVVRSHGESLPIDKEFNKSYANRRVEITICSSPESTSKN